MLRRPIQELKYFVVTINFSLLLILLILPTLTYHHLPKHLIFFVDSRLVHYYLSVNFVILIVRFFYPSRMIILCNNKIVLTGTRNKGGLWYVDPPESTDYSHISLKTIQTLPSASYHNCTTCNYISSSMHSVKSTVTFPATHVMSLLGPRGIIKD